MIGASFLYSHVLEHDMDIWDYIDDVMDVFNLNVITLLGISFLSTAALILVKTIQEIVGHRYNRFSMYKDKDIFYTVLGDIMLFFIVTLAADVAAIFIISFITTLIPITYIWAYIVYIWIICLFGTGADLYGCAHGNWVLGDYPLPMVYFNWIMDFWANGAVFLYLLGQDWILFNVVMTITFIVLGLLSIWFKSSGIEKKLRKAVSCPMS